MRIREVSYHRAPQRQHQKETDVEIEKIIRRRHRGRVENGQETRGADGSLRPRVEIEIIQKREDEENLRESPHAFPKDDGNRLVFSEKERPGNHKENRDGGLHPKRHEDIERKPSGVLLREVERKSGRGRMREHDEPNAEHAKKLDVQRFQNVTSDRKERGDLVF